MPPDTRFDFPPEDMVTPGEVWVHTFPLRIRQEDGSYEEAEDFDGFDNFAFYVFPVLDLAGETEELRDDAAYYKLVEPAINIATPPNITCTSPSDSTALVRTGNRPYELWCTVNGNLKRVAFGYIPVGD